MQSSSLKNNFEKKGYKPSIVFLVSFLIIFFVFFPLLVSRSVNKPFQSLDWMPMLSRGGDYVATYAAANSLKNGLSMYKNNASQGGIYTDQFASGEYSRYSYPPLQAYLFIPLSFFSFEHSLLIWNILSILLILASIFLVSQLVKHRLLAFLFLAALYPLSSFFWFQQERGQTDALSLFLITLFVYFYFVRKNIWLTAVFFALACLLKIFPVIFVLFFLVRKEFRLLAISFLVGAVSILLTGYSNWIYWLMSIYPMYANYYLGFEVDHSLAYFLSGFINWDFSILVRMSRFISVIISAVFFALVYIGKRRKELLILELAIISIIMDITPPWAANYKLVLLIFLFAVPLFLLEQEFTKWKIALMVPVLGAFVFALPIYNEFYARLPFSVFGWLVPLEFVPYFSFQKIAEYRVSVALVFCLLYLIFLYIYFQFKDARFFAAIRDKFVKNKSRILVVFCIAVFSLVSIGSIYFFKEYFVLKAKYRNDIVAYNKENRISDEISVVSFNMQKKSNGSYDTEIIFKIDKKLNKNLMVYLHGHLKSSPQSVEGINFYPYLLTNFWPQGRYVVVGRNISLTSKHQDIRMGFFDRSDGGRYGQEIDLGVFNLQ